MPIKIFEAVGSKKISQLEDEINDWLRQGHEKNVRQISTATTAFGEDGELFQQFVTTIWYDGA